MHRGEPHCTHFTTAIPNKPFFSVYTTRTLQANLPELRRRFFAIVLSSITDCRHAAAACHHASVPIIARFTAVRRLALVGDGVGAISASSLYKLCCCDATEKIAA